MDSNIVRASPGRAIDALIDQYVEPHPDPVKESPAWYRLKQRGVPVYAIIGSLAPGRDNMDDVADAFGVSSDAVGAAIAYYDQHRAAVDARLSS